MELIDQLTKSLGITEPQALGGAGLIFKQAKEKLSADEFEKVSKAVPGLDSVISAAPSTEGGALGGVDKMLGGAGLGGLGKAVGLAEGFSKLGLNAGMIGKFLPIILSFVESKGGSEVKSILERVIK